MKPILVFLIGTLKWLARPISLIKNSEEKTRYVLVDDALKSVEFCYHQWLSLARVCWVIMKAKRSSPMYDLHLRVQTVVSQDPELTGFDLKTGNPFVYLMNSKAMT